MKTILNKMNVDGSKEPLFCGQDLAIQRYDKPKYPEIFDLFKKQMELVWRPEEISLVKDRVDFNSLTDNEKFIFTSNLKFQIMLDTVVARGVPFLQKYVSNTELEACFNAWQFFETIHSYSYTYIIKNVFPKPEEIFDSILTNEEILKRAYSVTEEYDKLYHCEEKNVKKQIYLTLISINILEAVRFYVSFVCAFAFGENKKMIGNADIIKLIKRDEAYHMHMTQTILKILHNNEDEGFIEVAKECEQQVREMYIAAAEEEKAWAKYLFTNGSIIGLNEAILSQYIEWLTDSRMTSIGLEKHFGTKNPIGGWIEPWMESGAVQVAPQETEITSYKIGASVSDIEDLDLEDF